MERIIEKVAFPVPEQPRAERVAAYARVSSGKDAMLHSLSAQVSYYSDLIQNNPGWIYCGVYADEALTGTKESRDAFQRLISDCRAGKIDRVITKSISRFARNTVTLLEAVRELRRLGIDVFFEEQNIHTAGAEGELIMTILASYAQEESRSASENQKWRIKRKFEEGAPWCGAMLGYRQEDGAFVIVPDEAEIVRRIFSDYLDGKGIETIVKELNSDSVLTRKGYTWHKSSVTRILRNYNYTGNLHLQRFFSENHITKKKCPNRGELPQYMAEETHEAIISLDTFNRVQAEIEKRAAKFKPKPPEKSEYAFTGKIICAKCGKHYRRKTTATGPVWICSTYNSLGKSACPSKAVPEPVLLELAADIPFDEIIAEDGNILRFKRGGGECIRQWKDRSRSESWTPEKRAAAGEKARQRSKKWQEQ